MKIVFTLLLSFSFAAQAQNYQCLQSGVKHYFTNSNGYLRGIRIDSLQTFPDSMIYYPFHTARGDYIASPNLDSTGGSWLGKKVLQLSDGTFLFDNLWQDTVVIKTKANVGDSWIFYRDTTTKYYKADLISTDTMTILGSVDSIKRILVTAHNIPGIILTDPVDSFQIILSKNNGFAQIFDLYTFPYGPGRDYYLDKSIGNPSYPLTDYLPTGSGTPNRNNSIYKLISFAVPIFAQLYQWNVGDVYEYSICNGCEQDFPRCSRPCEFDMDTITSTITTTGNSTYNFKGWKADYPSTYMGIYDLSHITGTTIYDSTLVIDTTLMPEEFKQKNLLYYVATDSNFCIQGGLFGNSKSDIDNAQYIYPFEWAGPISVYKYPLGLLHSYSSSYSLSYMVTDQTLIYYDRGTGGCGTPPNIPTSVSNINIYNTIKLFPNPANDELNIVAPSGPNRRREVLMYNMLGQEVYSDIFPNSENKMAINISGLANGVYMCVVQSGASRWHGEFTVER